MIVTDVLRYKMLDVKKQNKNVNISNLPKEVLDLFPRWSHKFP